MESDDFLAKKHASFLKRTITVLPVSAAGYDATRLAVAFFSISGLDLLGQLDLLSSRRKEMIDWIYAMQIIGENEEDQPNAFGFRGGAFLGAPFNCECTPTPISQYDTGNLATTYTAIACLSILGDDFSRLNRRRIISGLRLLQLSNGSFKNTRDSDECDMRFVYCCCCIAEMLGDWGNVDKEMLVEYIKSCRNYDGGYGQVPEMESHGGSTLCAIASLSLMGVLDSVLSEQEKEQTIYWCISRQTAGFQGRPHKPEDTCYSYWIGASLSLLKSEQYINADKLCEYVMRTQHNVVGGMSKWPDCTPDPLHTYMGIAGLSLVARNNIKQLHPALNISMEAASRLPCSYK